MELNLPKAKICWSMTPVASTHSSASSSGIRGGSRDLRTNTHKANTNNTNNGAAYSPTTQPQSCAGDRLSESTWSTDNRIASPKCPMLTVQSWRGIWPMSNNELSGQASTPT